MLQPRSHLFLVASVEFFYKYAGGGVLLSLLEGLGWGHERILRRGWGKFSFHTRFEVRDGSTIRF